MGNMRFHYATGRGRLTSKAGSERRAAHRYSVVQDRVQLGWWAEETFRTTEARLIDLSQSGALIVSDEEPPTSTSVWISHEGPPASEWVEARVVGFQAQKGKPLQVRLNFRETCPYTFFRPAVYGTDAIQGVPRLVGDPAEVTSFGGW